MNLNEEIGRIKTIIFGKIINEQSESCHTLDEIMKGEIDTKNPERYRYYLNTTIKKIAKTGWGIGTNEGTAIKILKEEVKNLDDLIDFCNAWKNYIKEATDTANVWNWENELFNWIFNYETFYSYVKEEDDGNDIMSEFKTKWEQWISDECNKSVESITLDEQKYFVESMVLTVKLVKEYSHGKLVRTFDVTKLENEYGRGHGRFVWNIDFEITPTSNYSISDVQIFDNYTKKQLFDIYDEPVNLGKPYIGTVDYIQLGDFMKPWMSAKIKFNSGDIKEYTFGNIEYIAAEPSTTVKKECDTKNFTFQKIGMLLKVKIPKCNTKKKVSKLDVYTIDGKLLDSNSGVNDILLPVDNVQTGANQGTYFLVVTFSDKKQKLVKFLHTYSNTNNFNELYSFI